MSTALFLVSVLTGLASATTAPSTDVVLGNSKVEFTFETTATTLRLKSIRNVVSGYVFTQGGTNLWTLSLENATNVKSTIQPDAITGHKLSVQLVGGSRLVALWSKIPVGADKYNVFVQVDLLDDTAEFSLTVQSNQKNWRVTSVIYPKLELDPVAAPALFAPVRQGALTRDPLHMTHHDVFYPGGTLNTGSMQVFAYYDHDLRELLYLQSKDQRNYFKSVTMESRNGRVALDFVATPVNSTTLGNGYQSPYSIEIGAMHGRWAEAVARYRGWAATAPWAQRGTLEVRGNAVIDQSPYFMFAGFCDDVPADCDPNDIDTIDGLAETVIQWKDYLGFDATVPVPALWWLYGHPVDSHGKLETYPLVTVYPGTAAAVQAATAYGAAIAAHWSTIAWTYQSDSYYAMNIEPYTLRKKSGAPLVAPGGIVIPDQWFAALRTIHQSALATRIADDGLSGVYYDVVSGFAPIADYNAGLPTIGGGTAWGDGTKSLFLEHKSLFPGTFVSSEYPNEIYADLVDITQNNTALDNIGWYASDSWSLVPAYAMAYHAYQRQPPSIGMGLINAPEQIRLGYYFYAYNFSIGAMMSISATSQIPCYPTDPGLVPGGAEVYAFQRGLILQHARFLDYFATGEFVRPLEVQSDYVTRLEVFSPAGPCSDGTCFPQYDSGTGLGVSKVFASAYRSTSSNGLLLTLCNWWEDPAPMTVEIDAAELGLDDTKSFDLYDVTADPAQFVGNYALPFVLDDTAFPARTARLYKLVEQGTAP